MSYDYLGRTPEQARRERMEFWALAFVGLLFAALLGACVWAALA